ncbi:hypothetical protein [Tomitella biformata]|uniref:hypothetical protein n=1 Tax=Tomitella biformata TaxID=630403 RepID=UPI0011DC83D4|nr:hypothetical protein [Tomitella biformata]
MRYFDFKTGHSTADPFANGPSWNTEAHRMADKISGAGSELTRHLQNISEAMDNYDADLTATWVALLRAHAWDLATDAAFAYLSLAVAHSWQPDLDVLDEFFPCVSDPPAPLDAARWPVVPRNGVRKGIRAINVRTQSCLDEIDELEQWLTDYLEAAIGWCDDPDPVQVTGALIADIGAVVARVEDIVELWREYVISTHRKLAATQKGRRPPRFLVFEKQLEEIMAKFRADHRRRPAA